MLCGHATRSLLVFPFLLYCLCSLCAFSLLRVQPIILKGMYPRILSCCINWAKSHGSCMFEEEGEKVLVLLRSWDKNIIRKFCVATLYRYSSDPRQDVSTLGRLVDALGPHVSVFSMSGGYTILMEAFRVYLGSGYRQKLIDYQCFDFRWFKCSLQRTASSVIGNLEGLQ